MSGCTSATATATSAWSLWNLDDVGEVGVQRILLVVMQHPSRQNAAAARHDSRQAIAHQRQMFQQNPCVNCHVIDALLGVLLDHMQKVIFRQVF